MLWELIANNQAKLSCAMIFCTAVMAWVFIILLSCCLYDSKTVALSNSWVFVIATRILLPCNIVARALLQYSDAQLDTCMTQHKEYPIHSPDHQRWSSLKVLHSQYEIMFAHSRLGVTVLMTNLEAFIQINTNSVPHTYTDGKCWSVSDDFGIDL